jgi:hypothetical protein
MPVSHPGLRRSRPAGSPTSAGVTRSRQARIACARSLMDQLSGAIHGSRWYCRSLAGTVKVQHACSMTTTLITGDRSGPTDWK